MPPALPGPASAPAPDESSAAPPSRRRLWAAVLLAVALLAPALGWFAANREGARAALRGRIERELRARLPGARVGPSLRVDMRFRLVFGPVVIPARRHGAPPVVRVEEVRVRPRWRSLLRGRVEAALVTLDGVTVEAGRHGDELRALAGRLRSGAASPERGGASSSAEPPVVRFADVRLRAAHVGGAALEVGPISGQARLDREGPRRALEVRLRLPGRGAVTGRVVGGDGGASMTARVEHLTPEALPEALRRRLPAEIVDGALEGDVDGDGLTRAGGTIGWDLRLDHLVVSSPRLASEPVGPVDVVSRGRARLDLAGARLRIDDAEVRLRGDARAAAAIAVDVDARRRFDVRVDAPALDWAVLARSLPPQLSPGRDAPRITGTFGVDLHVAGPLHDPARWALDANVDLSSLARDDDRDPLRGTFRHEAQLTGGRTREIVVGPQNPAFASIASLPQHVVRAITTAEDAAFWSHDGFDFHELQDAIASGAQRGRLGRGASTISQQVAKNLWLGPERTIARKLREALLTVALEASLPKRRILEIYLNIAEWGPGIVGLGEAAHHYFGKEARDLDPKEAAFLASIIPNPVRFHMYCARGELSPAWEARVDELLTRLWSAGVLTTDQLDAARAERLVFTHGS